MVQAQLSKVDTWRQLAQQLRVGQHTLDNGRRIGSPLIFNVRSRSLMAVLLSKSLKYDFNNPQNPNNDHLIFSKGHVSSCFTPSIRRLGAITDGEILSLRKFGSRLEGHPVPVVLPLGRSGHRLVRDCPWASVWHLMESIWFARSTALVARGACCHVPRKPRRRRSPARTGMFG